MESIRVRDGGGGTRIYPQPELRATRNSVGLVFVEM
jgi:hypothetical protein